MMRLKAILVASEPAPVELLLALNGLLLGLSGLLHGPDEVIRRMAEQVNLPASGRTPVHLLVILLNASRVYAVASSLPGLRLALAIVMFAVGGFAAALFALGAPDSAYLPGLVVVAVANAWATFRLGVEYVRARK